MKPGTILYDKFLCYVYIGDNKIVQLKEKKEEIKEAEDYKKPSDINEKFLFKIRKRKGKESVHIVGHKNDLITLDLQQH